HVTIMEGKYHQIKRMIASRDNKVVYLKRISMGSLTLDETLPEGAFRMLNEQEIICLMNNYNP
ncbi:MAG: 16S rRNA pseudouridine(516) synthase, partial [Lachnospiraceae bacterium]|nr:16S rRNA pseudouridine(516) synthase [Lachnospiraceae bacterium]